MTHSTTGIYILGNDVVFDQLVALLNSIEANVGSHMPILIIPYDDRLEQVRQEIVHRPQVTLFEDQEAIARWETFATQVWQLHPTTRLAWQHDNGFQVYRLGMHRRFCTLDGPFERYIYLDADTLVLNSLDPILTALQTNDWVAYDFQHNDPTHVFNLDSPALESWLKRNQLQRHDESSSEALQAHLFCAGMYASHSGLFTPQRCEQLLKTLAAGDVECLYWKAPDQSILNYMVMQSQASFCNLAHQLPPEQVTGCCVTSPHFVVRNHHVYDRNVLLTYLHYIGVPAHAFTQLCAGVNLDIPYRDVFLHYRYLHEPEHYPVFRGEARAYNPPPSFKTRLMLKLGLTKG